MSNKLTKMALELLCIAEDLPFRLDYTEKPKPTIDDFDLYTFEQVWGSTALGFGGVGGQAMTTARTYVLLPTQGKECFVYFGRKFAYKADYGRKVLEDVSKKNMASVAMSGKYKTV